MDNLDASILLRLYSEGWIMIYFLEEFNIVGSRFVLTKERAIEYAKQFQINIDIYIEVWDAWPLENDSHYCVTCLSRLK
jgi:hypothetical protein